MSTIEKEFEKNFLGIINDSAGKYKKSEAAMFLLSVVEDFEGKEHFTQSALVLSDKSDYGSNGQIGGINVDHQTGVSYTRYGDATWITLGDLVNAVINDCDIPDWWDSEWTTGVTNFELAAEINDEAINKAAKRERFIEYGTGNPIVSIEYSHDNEYIYQKCGRLTKQAALTPSLLNHLNTLSRSDVTEAAHVFSEASNWELEQPT